MNFRQLRHLRDMTNLQMAEQLLKKRCVAVFEFESGKVAWYDFDSEQYRSPIRKNMIKVQGVRGELINNELYYLDENNLGRKETIVTDINKVMTGNGNPNLAQVNEIKKIAFGDKILYEPVWGLRGLSEDETAIATLMCKTAEYSRGQALPPYSLENAWQMRMRQYCLMKQ